MYELRTIGEITSLYHPDLGTIPPDPENRHYAEYLEWVAAGNEASVVVIEP
jgi:hypothetical protein